MSKLTLRVTLSNLQKKEYVEAMNETEYGWRASKSERFNHVGCPDDLYFISREDLPHRGNCFMECEDCWHYVLKNKKWK